MLWWLIPVIVLIVLLIACAIVTMTKRIKWKADDGVNTIEKQTLSMIEVVSFFRQQKQFQKLQASKDNMAVAIREKREDGSCYILLCVYNKATNSSEDLLRYKVSELSGDLKSAFGDKEMLVLQ